MLYRIIGISERATLNKAFNIREKIKQNEESKPALKFLIRKKIYVFFPVEYPRNDKKRNNNKYYK